MKKSLFGAIMLVIAISASAQNYKASFGINAGTFNGLSYKGFLSDHLVLQVDFGVNIEGTYSIGTAGVQATAVNSFLTGKQPSE